MRTSYQHLLKKLRQWLLLSTLAAVAPGWLGAHEVTPTIADLTVVDGHVTLDLRLNAEALLAGIDLDGLEDTDAAEGAADYDALRMMPPRELTPRTETFMREWAGSLDLRSGQGAVPLSFARSVVPPVGDPELSRASTVTFSGELPGGTDSLTFGWPDGAGALVLRQQGVDAPYTGYIQGGERSAEIALAGGNEQTLAGALFGYIPVGFDHIIPKGLDHILFVLGLFFLSARLGPLLWQVSAFTLAHTVTLALGALGIVSLPGNVVEPLIAASIVFVAVENILSRGFSPWRPLVVFLFGLLHGLGFASVLAEFGLPQTQFIPALIGFNIGVELGQLTVIAIAFALVGYWFRDKPWYRRVIAVPASLVIAAIGAYWVVERVFF